MTDEQIIGLILSGQTQSFALLVDRYKGAVFNLAYRFTGQREEAQDLAQEIFLKVYQNLGSFRGEASFKTGLKGIFELRSAAKKTISWSGYGCQAIGQTMDAIPAGFERDRRKGGDELFRRFFGMTQDILAPIRSKPQPREDEPMGILGRMGLSDATLRTLAVLAEVKGVPLYSLPTMVWRVAKDYRVHPRKAAMHLLQGEGWEQAPLEKVFPKP